MRGEYTNTVWRWCYGSYDKCACGKWKLPLYKSHRSAHRWGYKPCYHRKISDEHTKREFFSFYKKQSWAAAESAALNGRISGGRKGGAGFDFTITRPDSKRQWQGRIELYKGVKFSRKSLKWRAWLFTILPTSGQLLINGMQRNAFFLGKLRFWKHVP